MTGSRPLVLTGQQLADTNIQSSASFQYDPPYAGLKSTQQLNVDWSQFQNHTFFMSAEAKVNLSFDQIVNGFPFDGTRQETEVFFDNLTGFDAWVFQQFPTFHGELLFSSSVIPGNWVAVGDTAIYVPTVSIPASGSALPQTGQAPGTWIAVQNKVGALFPELVNNQNDTTGEPILNPTGSQSLTIEMQIYLPPIANDVQVICQMLNQDDENIGNLGGSTQGFSLFLTQSLSTGSVDATFVVVSGSSYMTVPLTLNKGQFNHVAFEWNRDSGMPFLESFALSMPVAESVTQTELDDLAIDNCNFLLGIGTPVQYGDVLVSPVETLNATIDEFRYFFSARTPQQQAAYASKALYSTPDLMLYFRFNEPTGSLNASNQLVLLDGTNNQNSTINAIVLDYSGNSLHSVIANFTSSLRQDATLDPLNPVTNERPDQCPILFPAYPPVIALNTTLLQSASLYDAENPNLVTKLIPQHYFLEGQQQDGTSEDQDLGAAPFGGTGIPGQGVMSNTQILVSLLYIYARFFDEIKLFVDSFSTLQTVDYDTNNVIAPDTVPSQFLYTLVKNYGFHIPPLFQDADIDQYIRGENVEIDDYSTNANTLKFVTDALSRRILKTLPSVLRSKGTQYSIQAFLRAIGIDPNNVMRMREVGGPTTQQLQFIRDNKVEPGTMVWFSGSFNGNIPVTSSIYVASQYLSASRVEPGFPLPQGSFIVDPETGRNTGTTVPSDNVLTSGSWTIEGIVRFAPIDISMMTSATQSLMRMCVVGGGDTFGDDASTVFGQYTPFGYDVSYDRHMGLVANLLVMSSSFDDAGNLPKMVLYMRPNALSGDSSELSPIIRLELDTAAPNLFTGPATVGVFNGDRWNFSFGCQRGDDGLGSINQSLYFLRLAYQNNGEIQYLFQTSSFFLESPYGGDNIFRGFMTTSSFPGPFLTMGPGQFIPQGTGTGSLFLNNTLAAPDEARLTDFTGRLSNVRFWSKALTMTEWEEHVRNYNSVGVENPLANWNYVDNVTGSWGRLRMMTMQKQDTRDADASGSITFVDFSENLLFLTGSGFTPNMEVVVGEIFDYSMFNPYFDEAATNNKVRARSFLNFDLVEQTPWAQLAPVYEVPPSEMPTDDVRFIMEFSLIEALNRDIITIFATLDALGNAVGDPDLLFSVDYPQVENLRDIYFNRIKAKLNFDAFLIFFRWFDTTIGQFISQLVPRKTNFKGVNFTVESHMLERHKMSYEAQAQIYVGDSNRTNLNAQLLLQQIAGDVSKY
jgi:hypothetical protein